MAALLALAGACTSSSSAPPTSRTAPPSTTQPEPLTGTAGVDVGFAGLVLQVARVVDPADVSEATVLPDPGQRYVQVVVRAANRSARGLSFTPAISALLFDDKGEPHKPLPGLYKSDLAGADVQPGQTVEGTLSFSLAEARGVDRVVFIDLQGVTTTVKLA